MAVGVDGSPASHRALLWAAEEARLRNTHLHVIHIAEQHLLPPNDWLERPDEYVRHVLAEAQQEAADCAAQLDLAAYTDLPTTMALAWDDPANGLATAAAGSAMMVMADHDPAGIRTLLLGSTAQRTADHAPCPVAVVKARTGSVRPSAHDDRVIVGIDDPPSSAAAITLAFEEAHLRNVGITAVHAWSATPQEITADVAWGGSPGPQAESMSLLNQMTAGGRHAYPDVDVRNLAAMGNPAEILTELSAGARILVVGSGRHSTITRRVLGSTTSRLIDHASCPVVIAPTGAQPT